MRMTRNRFPLWRVLFNMKVLLTRVDRGSFRFDLNFMYMTYFIFFLPSQISTQATCLQKLPDLPWLLLRYSWNLGLPFIFLVETYFLFFSLQPLNRGLLPLPSRPQTDSWHITIPLHKVTAVLCVPVWVSLKSAFEHKLFKMTDLLGVFLPTPSSDV